MATNIDKGHLAMLFFLLSFAGVYGQGGNYNFVREMEFTSSTEAVSSVAYADGLGRPSVSVGMGQSPSGGDLVTLTTYDGRGRESSLWLPVAMDAGDSPPAHSVVMSAARGPGGYADNYPFTEYRYEPSSLSRRIQTMHPGAGWHSAGKAVSASYGLNGEMEVVRYVASMSGEALQVLGYYAPGELDKTLVASEDGDECEEYADVFGRKVMTKRDGKPTYYVYDNASRLRLVLPPALDGLFNVGCSYNLATCQALRDYAYFYAYDQRGLCTKKKLPGCEPVKMVYDANGRLVFSQDGMQHVAGLWTFTLCDTLGRTVVTGVHRSVSDPYLANQSVHAEYGGDGVLAGYTSSIPLDVERLLTVNYYDGYGFINQMGCDGDSLLYRDLPPYDLGVGVNTNDRHWVKGLLTGKKTYLLGSADSIVESIFYNNEGRVTQTHNGNVRGGWEHYYHKLNPYTGDLLVTRHEHSAPDRPALIETTTYEYDNCRRLSQVTHSTNGSTPVTLASYSYDPVGRVASKTVGGVETTTYRYNIRSWPIEADGPRFTERLLYNQDTDSLQPNREHEYKWDGKIAAYGIKAGGETEMRGFRLIYDGLGRLTEAHYGEGPALDRNYLDYDEKVDYDDMGNPVWVMRRGQLGNGHCAVIDDVTLEYDGNRVVKTTDDGYIPTWSGAFDFVDIEDESVEYEYDLNGNMTKDLDRDIAEIKYNLLNLPSMMTFQDGSLARYTYAATGEKLRVDHGIRMAPALDPAAQAIPLSSGGESLGLRDLIPGGGGGTIDLMDLSRVDYCGSVVYDRGVRKLLTDEGYVTFADNGIPQYHYYLRDHLGNIRVVMAQDGTVEQKTHYYPFGGIMYGSAGQGVQPYKYGGKEFDRTNGLDSYDFGARMYFPDRIQWMTVDPMCEKYYNVSPYAYCGNNPVRYIDPDGRRVDDVYFNEDGYELFRVKKDGPNNYYVINTTKKTNEIYTETALLNQKGWTNPISIDDANTAEERIMNGYITGEHMKNVTYMFNSCQIDGILNSIKDDGKGGTSPKNNREYSGNLKPDGVKDTKEGPVGDPSSGQYLISFGNPDYHSHASGTKPTNKKGYSYAWQQGPSAQDIRTAKKDEYVIGMGSGLIYKFNKNGVFATIPISALTPPKKEK